MKIYIAQFEGQWFAWKNEGDMELLGEGNDRELLLTHLNPEGTHEVVDAEAWMVPPPVVAEGTTESEPILNPTTSVEPEPNPVTDDEPCDCGCGYVPYKAPWYAGIRSRAWIARNFILDHKVSTGILIGLYIACKIFIKQWPWWL